MAVKKELIQFQIENRTLCSYDLPLFQQNVYSINATTKYSWDITAQSLACGEGSIVINGITYSFTYTPNLTGLLASLNALGFGFFCYEVVLGSTFIYTTDDINIYGNLDLCTIATTTTSTTTSTTTIAPTTSTTTSTTTQPPAGRLYAQSRYQIASPNFDYAYTIGWRKNGGAWNLNTGSANLFGGAMNYLAFAQGVANFGWANGDVIDYYFVWVYAGGSTSIQFGFGATSNPILGDFNSKCGITNYQTITFSTSQDYYNNVNVDSTTGQYFGCGVSTTTTTTTIAPTSSTTTTTTTVAPTTSTTTTTTTRPPTTTSTTTTSTTRPPTTTSTTTTTTTVAPTTSTTTTSTTRPPTTTTTTTTPPPPPTTTTTTTSCLCYNGAIVEVTTAGLLTWLDCNNAPQSNSYGIGPQGISGCIKPNTWGGTAIVDEELTSYGPCCSS